MKRAFALFFISSSAAFSCKRLPAESSIEETHGCITLMDGKETSCTEVDPSATEDERAAFAKACVSSKLLEERRVAHCEEGDIVAVCALKGERMTMRYYRKGWSSETERGASIGCKIRGGAFEAR